MMKIVKSADLSTLSTFKIGGKAKYFCRVKTLQELQEAISYAKEKNLRFFILGGGSNIIFPDEGFVGLVIKMELKGVNFEKEKNGIIKAEAFAGEGWDKFVQKTVKKNLYGLENLSGIPGTVGGAPVQNIGAYGVELKDVLHSVKVLDTEDLKEKELKPEDCRFTYRDSVFKKPLGRSFIILSVIFNLKKKGKLRKDYPDIKKVIKEKKIKNLDPKKMREIILYIRKKKFPNLKSVGTAGSFFKNPIIGEKRAEILKKKFPKIPLFPVGDGEHKVSLAWILDNVCNLKGYKLNQVGTYKKQPLVIVNFGKGKSADLQKISQKISKEVFRETGIKIEREVTFVEEKFK